MENELPHYGGLLVMKGIDIEENDNSTSSEGQQRQQSNFINFGPV